MDDCQHDPSLILQITETQTPNGPSISREAHIMCRRCGVAIPSRPASLDTPMWRAGIWGEWAALMAAESDAKRKRLEQVDPASIALTRDAEMWRAFVTAARPRRCETVLDARALGERLARSIEIARAVERHLAGVITEQRINDLFIAMRKATKAFHLNARIMLPPADADGKEQP